MDENLLRILSLYLNGQSLTDEEAAQLQAWIGTSTYNEDAINSLDDKMFIRQAIRQRELYGSRQDKNWEKLVRKIGTRAADDQQSPVKQLPFFTGARVRYAAAILLVFAGALIYVLRSGKETSLPLVAAKINDKPAPIANRAMITLANGQQIYLDSMGAGKLAMQGPVDIEKTADGRIVYNGVTRGPLQYNTLTVPRGSRPAMLVLSDGSKVFLNSASSLKYPVAFSGNERAVEIAGEAYFEVTKDPRRKFVVLSRGITTEVLGTHFDVNTYTDEENSSVTLLEGSVKVSRDGESLLIRPGEQARASGAATLELNRHPDLAQVMAWQKGMFIFADMPLEAILRQVSRWYDVEVRYQSTIPATSYGGGLSRSLPVSGLIKLLETDSIGLKLVGNTLFVQTKNKK